MRPWHTLQTDHQSVRASRVVRFGDCLGADSGSLSESSRWNGVLNCAPVYVEDICATANAARLAISNAGAAWSISSPTPRTGAFTPWTMSP